MHWETPSLLFALWLLPLLAWLLVRSHRRTLSAARAFADERMLARIVPAARNHRLWLKGLLLVCGIGLLVLAAARPRFGVYFERVSQRGIDVVVLLDVSRSMLAEDVAPDRLERAKSDIRDLLQKMTGDRAGLIVFAGAAVVKAPLTTDHGFYRLILDEVGPHSAPRGGSLIGDAIRKAIASLGDRRDRDRAIVLITDGEDHDSFPLEAAKQAGEMGIRIITVGLGDTTEGARIPVRKDGQLRYVRHDGQEVWSRMDEQLLQEIAMATNGAYIPAQTRVYDLGRIYEDHLVNLTRSEINAEKRKRFRERYQWIAAMGIFLLMADMLLSKTRTVHRIPTSGVTV